MSRRANFGTGTVETPPSPPDSGTSLTLETGQGDRFVEAPFYAVLAPEGVAPTKDNAEVVYVTSRTDDSFGIVRAQKGTTAKNIAQGWRMTNAIFAEDTLKYSRGLHTPIPAKFSFFDDLDSGFSDFYSNGTVAHDNTDFINGAGSLKITTDGAGSLCGAEKTISSTDLTDKVLRIYVKSDNWAKLFLGATLILSSDSGTWNDFYFLHIKDVITSPPDGDWIEIFISFDMLQVNGSPDISAINSIILRTTDDNTATAVNLWFDAFAAFDEPAEGMVSICFDDGYESSLDNGLPVLEAHGFRATWFIIPEVLGQSTYMTQADIDTLHRKGHEIGGHGATNLVDLEGSDGIEAVDSYLQYVKEWCVEHGYRGQELFAYPNGAHNDEVADTVLRYFSLGRGLSAGMASPAGFNPRVVHARTIANTTTTGELQTEIDNAIANKKWLVLTFHRIVTTPSVETEYSIANLTTVMSYLASQNVKVVPMGEAIRRMA